MDDHLDEELEIMSEQSSAIRVELDAEIFEQPLTALVRRPALTLGPDDTVERAVELLRAEKRGSVLIVEKDALVGIVTERDLMMKVGLDGTVWKDRPLRQIMTPNPDALHLDDAIKFVMSRMHLGGYRHVPVVDDAMKPLGVISLRDLLRFLLDRFPKLVTHIPPRPPRGEPPWGG